MSRAREELLAALYFGGLSLSFTYTGGIGFKYLALGDLIIVVSFGPMSVLFAFVAQLGRLPSVAPLFLALPLALHAEATLHGRNTRDIESDRRSGIATLAIALGFTGSYLLYTSLIFGPFFAVLVAAVRINAVYALPILTVPMAFSLEKKFRERELVSIPRDTAILNSVFGFLYVVACFLASA